MTPRRTFWRMMGLALFGAVVGFGAIIGSRRPSNERVWAADHARIPEIVRDGDRVRIGNVRNFRWVTPDSGVAGWESRTYDLSQVTTVWFVLAPFSTSWRGPAHSFVTFGFADSTFLAISVEARREAGESYGIWKGLGRNYELIYVIGDERDLVGKRAAFGDTDVYLYPIRTTPERARAVLSDMLDRAERIGRHPEFYNTVSNSCTSNLVASVNRVVPGRIGAGWRLLLPGYADEVARTLGLIDSTAALEAVRNRYRINARARDAGSVPDFSLAIRR